MQQNNYTKWERFGNRFFFALKSVFFPFSHLKMFEKLRVITKKQWLDRVYFRRKSTTNHRFHLTAISRGGINFQLTPVFTFQWKHLELPS